MARDLSIYLSELVPGDEGVFDASDERLLAIIDLFDKRKFALAADKAQELADAGVFDIRPLSYLLFVAFYEDGIAALGSVFDVVTAALGPQAKVIGPQKNQQSFFAKRLVWLFTTIADHLAYYRKEGGADWDRTRAGLTIDSLADILDRGKQVDTALTTAAHEKTAMVLATLMGALRTLAAELEVADQAAKNSAVETSSSEEDEDEIDSDTEKHEEDSEEQPERVAKVHVGNFGKRAVKLDVSSQFMDLLAKLRAFEELVGKGDLMKAAVVAEDVQNSIESFDPRVYFPSAFSRFSELLSHHSEELGEHIENRDSFAWKTMSQFYKVDLEKFVKGGK